MTAVPEPPIAGSRLALRRRLLAERIEFASRPEVQAAQLAMGRHLHAVLHTLEPVCLGVYWPVRCEFNAPVALASDPACAMLPLALPFVQKQPPTLHYRAWDGKPPAAVDEARIPTSTGPAVTPDVVLVPCVGFTPAGYRLGYGGGYFDRWMAAHPQVTTVGIAWAFSALDATHFEPQAHDQPLSLVLTEAGVVAQA